MRAAGLLSLFALLAFAQIASAGFVDVVYTATLSGTQVVPGPGADSFGTAVCIYNRYSSPVSLDCQVEHNVTDILSLGLYNAGAGNTGPLLFSFDVSQGRHLRQVFEIPAEDQQNEFLFGRFYLEATSNGFPTGHTRGQLQQNDRAYAIMSADQTIPPATGSTSEGILLATYSFTAPDRFLSFDAVHDVAGSEAIQVKSGQSNQVGNLVATLESTTSPSFTSLQLTEREGEEFLEDLLFINIVSANNPMGDIRGQLISIDYLATAAFTARLNGAGAGRDTPHSGCAIVAYDCASQVLDYVLFHSLEDASSAFIGVGPAGDNGNVLATVSSADSPAYGSVRLTADEALQLYTDRMFFTVFRDDRPEIRGQLGTDFEFWAYLSGTQELGPVTVPYHGCGLMRLVQDADDDDGVPTTFQYEVHHNVPNPISAGFFGGSEGEAGPLRHPIENLNVVLDDDLEVSPWTGEIDSDDDEIQGVLQERFYVNIATEDHPSGVIRGNFKELDPCNDDGFSDSFNPSNSYGDNTYFSQFYSPVYSASIDFNGASMLTLSCAAIFVLSAAFLL